MKYLCREVGEQFKQPTEIEAETPEQAAEKFAETDCGPSFVSVWTETSPAVEFRVEVETIQIFHARRVTRR